MTITIKNYHQYLNSFVRLMYKPVDGHSLAVFRIAFGFLMLIDLQVERAFHKADERWSDPDECRFPLLHWIQPLPGPYMNLLYFFMTLGFILASFCIRFFNVILISGTIGMIVGYKYKLASTIYTLIYWYIFLLDKSYWNNHTYLFGLIAIILTLSDAHKIWSLDYRKSNEKIPFWQYFIIRYQISLVYFLAGVKKANLEWIGGYSMSYLSDHWVFSPFRLFLSSDLIDLIIVHWGGFVIDSSVGFLLLFQFTRPLGYLFTGLFNSMNSQMFSIGMFPYVMIAVLPIYSSPDWPIALTRSLNIVKIDEDDHDDGDQISESKSRGKTCQESKSCTQKKISGKTMDVQTNDMKLPASTPNWTNCQTTKDPKLMNQSSSIGSMKIVTNKQRLACVGLVLYMGLQLGLPFSHNLTQGYNTWTQGVYGYSWDMMVHNWRLLGKRILIVDKQSKREMYLNVEKYSPNNRWTHHADMAKQFADCLEQRLKKTINLTDFEIHIDVWMSLNKRFAQRIFDPRVDLLAAKWSPFEKPSWVFPMLTQFTSWRSKLREYEERIFNSNSSLYVVFMADFPGLEFVNYVDPQFGNTTFKVLSGWVKLQVEESFIRIMSSGDESKLPSGKFHSVIPIKSEPASYMYTFTNTTAAKSMWELDNAHNVDTKSRDKDLWIIRFYKKWIRSFQITYESLYTIGVQAISKM